MRTIRTQNPATEVILHTYTTMSEADVDARLAQAVEHFAYTRRQSVEERQRWLRQLAEGLERNAERAAAIATMEMGKTNREARGELYKCAAACRYYAEHAPQMLAPHDVGEAATVYLEPLGPLLAIMPWNFPYWQVIRALAPAIALGNPVLLKHAENVWGCAQILEDIVHEAGLPSGAFQQLRIRVAEVARVIADARVRAVTLTGSERAGRAVAAQAGAAIKPVVLELGGSDAFVVLADADFDAAVDAAVRARYQNAGQSCIAAKRFIVEAPLYDRFVRALGERVAALVCDDPVFESTDVGPLAREDLREQLDAQVRTSVGFGARAVTGGEALSGRGFFYAPTVLAEVHEELPAFREELFGPVASVIVARDEEDAVRLANATPFGLGASIWTTPARGRALASSLDAGVVSVNRMTASDPRLPFGGIKNSGIGRELSVEGLRAFANIKAVVYGD